MEPLAGNMRPRGYAAPRSEIEKYLVEKMLRRMLAGSDTELDFGDSVYLADNRNATFIMAAPRLLPLVRMLIWPGYSVGAEYVRGAWYLKKGNLGDFLRAVGKSGSAYARYYALIYRIPTLRHILKQLLFVRFFTRKTKQHYDVDTEIYELFLEKDMNYTCAFYETDEDTLETAQRNKVERIIERLDISQPDTDILDIGCGWGGLARYLVKRYPTARVTGISISSGQIAYATRQAETRLTISERERLNYVLADYADFSSERPASFDRIVVVGMLEHVGLRHYPNFIAKIASLLRPAGKCVIHTIICPLSGKPANPWIDQNIFQGGYAPSLSEIIRAIEDRRMVIEGLYIHDSANYFRTLQEWKIRFERNWSAQYDWLLEHKFRTEHAAELFFRTWYFYLNSVQAMFDRDLLNYQVAHLVIAKS